ncbi:hypothetical protein BDZ89DRAFT_209949 [Hymenopellis radicata]|nr:hypothetical protein BDZ89DRAFT_209949 [Hymenopellis radicata]
MPPVEVLIEILLYAIPIHPEVTSILCTSSLFLLVSRNILHQSLHFRSVSQLAKFAEALRVSSLACSPRNIAVDIAGGASGAIFPALDATLERICSDPAARMTDSGTGRRLELDHLRLVVNSHIGDPHPEKVFDALNRVNPARFLWTGPDPPHHFSTAIVATVTPHLFSALSKWSNLQHLTLTNMAFYPSSAKQPQPLPNIPSLRSFYLGQVVCLHATAVAAYLVGSADSLQTMTLVDVYHESIWGPRVKKDHVLAAVPEELRDAISPLLCVGSKTERIMGGDPFHPEW